MYDSNRNPLWFTDAKWFSAILLTLLAVMAALSFVLGRATESIAIRPVTERILALALVPDEAQQAVAVREVSSYVAGQPLELLPGTGIYADPTEIPSFTVLQAQNRIAGVLTEEIMNEGVTQALQQVQGSVLGPQLDAAVAGPITQLVRAQLAAALLPAGLDNGSRMADWRLQARQRPGQPVQPIVGVFVQADAARLETLSAAEIGGLVVDGVADTLLAEGLPAARELISNAALLQRLEDTAAGPVRSSLHGLLVTVLLGYSAELDGRLTEAQAVLRDQAAATPAQGGIPGLIPEAELAGLTVAQANERIIAQLAGRAWLSGSSGVLAVITDPAQVSRVQQVSWLLDALSEQAHRSWLRSAWLYGSAALVLAVLLAVFSSGWGRLLNPGIAITLAAGSGALLSRWLVAWQQSLGSASLPAAGAADGVLGQLSALLRFVMASLPQATLPAIARDYLLVTAFGAALIVISVLGWLFQVFRPRRRSRL